MSEQSQRLLLKGFARDGVRWLERGGGIFRIAQDVHMFEVLDYPRSDIKKHYARPILAAIKRANLAFHTKVDG